MLALTRWLRILLACLLLWAAQASSAAPVQAAEVVAVAGGSSQTLAREPRSARHELRDRASRGTRWPVVAPAIIESSIRAYGVLGSFVLIEQPYLRHCVLLC